ncbi:MAG: trypsin-like peptidase domain-containing protein [Actinobacteria bacterium]|nr:trypsin-like peptidase domain-containing protein [Actinomycetota bacterium]
MTGIQDLQQALAGVAESVGASTVGIGGRRSAGSGIVIGEGRVLTNAHNLRSSEVTVTFADGRSETAGALGSDVDKDVAVIGVDTKDVPAPSWGKPENLGIGSFVVAASNPGGRGLRVTFGSISGVERSFRGPRGRRIGGSLEHTAPLLPGSSGGPLVDLSGAVVGLNTNRLGDGFYLAIPADDSLKQAVDALARGEEPARPRLGIAIAPPEVGRGLRRAVGLPEVDGLLIRGVEEGGVADAAGLEEGDLIVTVSGAPVESADQLHETLEQSGLQSLELEVLRGAETRRVTVTLQES